MLFRKIRKNKKFRFIGTLNMKQFTLTCIIRPTRKAESQRVILVGRSNMNFLYLSPLCQTLSKAFSASRKVGTTCCSLLKLSITDWDSLNRWLWVDLACLKPDWYLFIQPVCWRWERSLCSVTHSNSFIIEADGPITSSKGWEFVRFQ